MDSTAHTRILAHAEHRRPVLVCDLPALREVLTYDQPAGKAFSIDSFPDNQHDPITDHGDFENVSSGGQAQAVATCINENQQCTNVKG